MTSDNHQLNHWCSIHWCKYILELLHINSLRPRQNGRHFPDNIFKCICMNKNAGIPIKISQKCVFKGPINNTPALVQIMAWHRHICVTGPQWVNMVCFDMISHITWPLQIKYMTDHNFTKDTPYLAHWRHPIARPHRRAMECLLCYFWRKIITLSRGSTVYVVQ